MAVEDELARKKAGLLSIREGKLDRDEPTTRLMKPEIRPVAVRFLRG